MNIDPLINTTIGHEYMVLQGAQQSLKSGIITTVFCENAPNLIAASGIDLNEYYHFMINLGFLPYNDIDDLLMVSMTLNLILSPNLICSLNLTTRCLMICWWYVWQLTFYVPQT